VQVIQGPAEARLDVALTPRQIEIHHAGLAGERGVAHVAAAGFSGGNLGRRHRRTSMISAVAHLAILRTSIGGAGHASSTRKRQLDGRLQDRGVQFEQGSPEPGAAETAR
jgi:hypothetical protein